MSEVHMNGSESSQSEESTPDGAISDQSQLIDLVRERPWVCLLGAAALGFVLARFVRGAK